MFKSKKIISFLIILVMMIAIMPLNVTNAAITDVEEGATTNSKITLEKKETGTEEVSYDTNLEEYIANKKNAWINSLTSEPDYKDEWLSLYVSSNGIYKYPVALHTYFTGVTTSNSDTILVGDPIDLIDSGVVTYNYRLEYKEITVTKAENPNEISNVNIKLEAPKVGDKVLPQGWTGTDTENIIDDGTMEPDKYPTATSSTEGVKVDSAYWINGTYTERPDDWELLYFGTFKENTYYYAYIDISALEGKTLNSNLTIKVNGKTPAEVFTVYNNENTHFVAKIKAVEKEVTPITYEFVEGANQTYTINEDDTATFRLNADYSLFENGGKVYIDDALVSSDNYISKSGSTIITFTKDYMSSLSEGEHTLKVAFNDNGTATTKFTIAKSNIQTTEETETTTAETTTAETATAEEATTEETTTEAVKSDNPQTGDNIILFMGLFVIATLGTCIIIKYNKNSK